MGSGRCVNCSVLLESSGSYTYPAHHDLALRRELRSWRLG